MRTSDGQLFKCVTKDNLSQTTVSLPHECAQWNMRFEETVGGPDGINYSLIIKNSIDEYSEYSLWLGKISHNFTLEDHRLCVNERSFVDRGKCCYVQKCEDDLCLDAPNIPYVPSVELIAPQPGFSKERTHFTLRHFDEFGSPKVSFTTNQAQPPDYSDHHNNLDYQVRFESLHVFLISK